MAAPGEWFPQNFALAIISAAESRRRADAQIADMREQRAAENFLQEQRLRLGQQQLQSSEAQNEAQAQIALERAKLDAKRIEQEREATVARSIAEFGRTGTAFIPTYAADKIPALMGDVGGEADTGGTVVEESVSPGATPGSSTRTTSGPKTLTSARQTRPGSVTSIELPGFGTILQRVGGPGFEKIEADVKKAEALTQKYLQEGALAAKRAEAASIASYERAKRVSNMEGKLSLDSLRLANNVREGLRKQAEETLLTLRISRKPEDIERANKAAHDLSYVFPEDSEEKRNWDLVSEIIESGLSAQQKGIQLPQKTDGRLMEALGVDKLLFGGGAPAAAPQASPAKIVGRVTQNGQTFFVTEDRQLIPTTDTQTPLSLVGGAPPAAAPAPLPGPAAQPAKPKATPEQVQAALSLRKQFEQSAPGSAERKRLAAEIRAMSDAIDFGE